MTNARVQTADRRRGGWRWRHLLIVAAAIVVLLIIGGTGAKHHLAARQWPQLIEALEATPSQETDEYPFFYVDVTSEVSKIVAAIGISEFADILAKEGRFRRDARYRVTDAPYSEYRAPLLTHSILYVPLSYDELVIRMEGSSTIKGAYVFRYVCC